MKTKISQINLIKYLPFFSTTNCKENAIAICNYIGKPLAFELSDEFQNKSGFNFKAIASKINGNKISENKRYLHCENEGYIFFSYLTLGVNETPYYLIGFQKTKEIIPAVVIDEQAKRLLHISKCLSEDCKQAETIMLMADELAIRYKELNLLYGISDFESFNNDHEDEEESLKRIAQNGIDYLDVDYVAIYVPDQGFFFHLLGNQVIDINEVFLEQVIRQQIYGYCSNSSEILVSNGGKGWTYANLNIPYKLIAAPILKVNSKVLGLIVLINSLDKVNFSNSDRKLTEVLAVEASKLIQARRDPATEQLNRRGFSEILGKILGESHYSDVENCLIVIDLDRFKMINDAAGQKGGDQLLIQITGLILKNIKKTDILSRLGSDEFAIILKQCDLKHAIDTVDRIRLVIKQFRFLYQEKMFDLSASFGVVELTTEIKDISQALGAADLACSVAKEQGGNRAHVYSATDEKLLKHESQVLWVSRINLAIEGDLFQIYRQKIELLQENPENEEHYEILIRLKQKNGDVLLPFHFIPAAERYNLMPKIDRWVIKTTLNKMAEEFAKKPGSKLMCSINLSGQSFSEEGFVAYIKDQINITGVPANRICLEMTETAAVSNLMQAVKFMEDLKEVGCHFSLDDFGSGMSSFTYLKNLPVDYLKIDGYFVKTMLENKIDKAMVNSIHQIGHVMGLKTIAEFVENDDIMNELKAMGITYGQGYGIHKPEHFI